MKRRFLMITEKVRAEEEAQEEAKEDDYFERLPDDIVISIFDRVKGSAKFLIQCLLLSKRIASLVRFVSSISVTIHLPHPDSSVDHYNLVYFRSQILIPTLDVDINFLWKLEKWPFWFNKVAHFYMLNARKALRPFHKVESVTVEYTKSVEHYIDTRMMRWMVEYSGDAEIIKSCAFLGPIQDSTRILFPSEDYDNSILTWIASLFQLAFNFHPMVVQMAHDHESLRDILVTDNSGKGCIHSGEDEIVKMRQAGGSADALKTMMKNDMNMIVKVWAIPMPNPPGSGIYGFVVISSLDNIEREVKAAGRRFFGDCNYWVEHDDELIKAGIERINMKEMVETKPCNLEFNWIANFEDPNGMRD